MTENLQYYVLQSDCVLYCYDITKPIKTIHIFV